MVRHIDAETPPSLLLRLRNHRDEKAWATFCEVYSPLVYNFCRLKNLQPTDAADVTQEVLLRISKSITTFEYDRSQGLFRDWVARIVSNEVKRHFSKKQLKNLSENWDSEETGDLWTEHFHQHIFSTAMSRCKPSFSEETWQLFDLSWLQKMPAKEVAERMKVDIAKVYVARSRVLKQLRFEVTVLADDIG
ncbi:MAG: RNA polymerase sigma factor [Pirellulaceae bacterium]